MVRSREYPSAPIAGVGAVVIDRGYVLLVRRGHEPLLGQWSVPGGAVELGETLEEAIVREVKEETGLTVQPVSILTALDRIERDSAGSIRFHYVLVDFLCEVSAPGTIPRATTDVSDARWVPFESLQKKSDVTVPNWTLEVIEMGWRRVRESRSISP